MQLQCPKSYFEFNIYVNDLIAALNDLPAFYQEKAENGPFKLCDGTVGKHLQYLSSL